MFLLELILISIIIMVVLLRPKYGVYLSILTNIIVYDIAIATSIRINPAIVVILCNYFSFLFLTSKGTPDFGKEFINIIKNKTVFTLYITLIFFLFISWLYSILLSSDIDYISLLRLLQIFISILIYPIAIISCYDEKELNNFLKYLIILSSVSTIIVLAPIIKNVISGIPIDLWVYSDDIRMIGVFGHYVGYGGIKLSPGGATGQAGLYLAFIASLSLIFIINKNFNILFLFIFILFILAIVATFSRASILVFILLIIVIGYRYRSKRFIATMGILLLSFVIIDRTPFGKAIIQRIATTISLSGGKFILDPSMRGRIVGWSKILNMQLSNLLFTLFGIGYSTINLKNIFEVNAPHSLLIGTYAYSGIIGITVLLTLWIALVYKTYKLMYTTNPILKGITSVLFGFVLGWIFVNIFSGGDFFSDRLIIPFWGLLGLTEGAKIKILKYTNLLKYNE